MSRDYDGDRGGSYALSYAKDLCVAAMQTGHLELAGVEATWITLAKVGQEFLDGPQQVPEPQERPEQQEPQAPRPPQRQAPAPRPAPRPSAPPRRPQGGGNFKPTNDDTPCFFSKKYKGCKMSEVPDDFLKWALENLDFLQQKPDVLEYINSRLAAPVQPPDNSAYDAEPERYPY